MYRILLITILIISFICCCAYATAYEGKVLLSSNNINLNNNENNFTLDVFVDSQKAFSSADFGIKLEGNVKVLSIAFNNQIISNNTKVLEKDGIYYFSFFDNQNKYINNFKVCTLKFEYQGNNDAKISINEANISIINSDRSGATKVFLESANDVTIKRLQNENSVSYSNYGYSNSEKTKIVKEAQNINNISLVSIFADDIENVEKNIKINEYNKKIIEIDIIQKVENYKSYLLSFPIQAFEKSNEDIDYKINTKDLTIQIPKNSLQNIQIDKNNKLELNFSITQQTNNENKAISEKPILDIFFTQQGKRIDFISEDYSVKISIPYNPSDEEIIKKNNIIVYYIDNNNNLHEIKNSKYDEKNKTVNCSLSHFSKYIIGFASKEFDDTKNSFAKNEIESLAVRKIINGTSNNSYSPNESITRADFVKILVGVIGKNKKSESKFTDVDENSYFAESINTATALNLINGIGDKKFEPYGKITRQDMMVLIDRVLQSFGKKLENKADLETFLDYNEVSDYSKESIKRLVSSGIIKGDSNNIKPKANLTRAEAARVLYLLFNEIY